MDPLFVGVDLKTMKKEDNNDDNEKNEVDSNSNSNSNIKASTNDENINEGRNYEELAQKIEGVSNLLKEGIQLCQQIFIFQDSSDRSQHYNQVVDPLISALDLVSSSLNNLVDISQLEEKFEIDSEPLDANDCSVKIEKTSKRKRVKREKDAENDEEGTWIKSEHFKSKSGKSFLDNDWSDNEEKDAVEKYQRNKKIKNDDDYSDGDNNAGGLEYQMELKCEQCNFKTEDKSFYNHHIKGFTTWRKCPWCPSKIKTGGEDNFKKHMTKEHPELFSESEGFICRECQLLFFSMSEYDVHLTEKHDLGYNFHCKIKKCSFMSTYIHVIKDHVNDAHLKNVKCSLCSSRFSDDLKLNEHIAEKHTRMTCNVCEKEVESKAQLVNHMKQEHNQPIEGEDTCICNICGETYKKSYLKFHMKNVHDESKTAFKCDECDYTSAAKNYLKQHKERKHGAKTLLCDLCPFVGSRISMTAHKRIHSEKKLSCKECDFTCVSKGHLNKHMLAKHTPKELRRTFHCDICLKAFLSNGALKEHLKLHDDNNLLKCTQPDCDYQVFSKDAMKLHVDKVHLGIRYPCVKCDYVGNYNSDLNSHIRLVHEGNSFNCDECEYKTSKQCLLDKHIKKKHLGEKCEVNCEICGYAARDNHMLNDHVANIHHGISYMCFICSRLFPGRWLYRKHLLRTHKTKISKTELKSHIVINK